MDVMKAGVHKKKTHLQYYQCYRGVRAWKDRKEITDPMSFQLLGPYVEQFREQNLGSTAVMEKGDDNQDGIGSHRTLDAGLPNLTMAHYRVGCPYKLFLFQLDRQKGLSDAFKACFPANHHCYCAVHIRWNVEVTHGKKIGVLVPGLVNTTSRPGRDAKLALGEICRIQGRGIQRRWSKSIPSTGSLKGTQDESKASLGLGKGVAKALSWHHRSSESLHNDRRTDDFLDSDDTDQVPAKNQAYVNQDDVLFQGADVENPAEDK
ncbi:hypothetical protein IV203_021004 [Nitzschia inconspicua]|uniref:Uncharacterized protein n=1 Tax=Nitzschia inconspicua TaxID=303405 RepID=A0A9K3KGU7_9STRA|nr:hypothetical protein IV203_021004 [Nitzschia inconspicua]